MHADGTASLDLDLEMQFGNGLYWLGYQALYSFSIQVVTKQLQTGHFNRKKNQLIFGPLASAAMLFAKFHRVGWGKMSMVGQSESAYIFVPELKAKELKIAGSSVLPFVFQWENKNVDLITMGSLIFFKQIKILSDLLCPIILILPHPTLLTGKMFQSQPCVFIERHTGAGQAMVRPEFAIS